MPASRSLAPLVILGLALALAACGKRGEPELPAAEAAPAAAGEAAPAGAPNATAAAGTTAPAPAAPARPHRSFILDGLL